MSDVAAVQADEATRPSTLSELRESGYRARSIREEMRGEPHRPAATGRELFPGIVGYDERSFRKSKTRSSPGRTSSSSASAVRPRPAWRAA